MWNKIKQSIEIVGIILVGLIVFIVFMGSIWTLVVYISFLNIIIIISFNFILYYKTLSYGLIMDDDKWYSKIKEQGIYRFKYVNNLESIKYFIQERLYGGTTFGTNERIEHSFTLILHIFASCLIYIVFGYNNISFFASILYSCNPINHSTSIWLNGRRYLINVILVLLIMIVWKYGIWGRAITILLYLSTGIFHLTALFTPVLFGIGNLGLLACFYVIFGNNIIAIVKSRSDAIAESDIKHFSPETVNNNR